MEAPYPAHWEADVVLADGGTAHVRPIKPADADRLRAFYSRLSDESIYFRFFGPRPRLSDKEVAWFTTVDYVDRVALIATIGTEMVAVIRYDKTGPGEAEVAFLVEDAHQGRGVASVLLEHLAATARERGIQRFVADVLPANMKMMGVLRQAGYTAESSFADGVVRMTLDLTPTETSTEVTTAREHRAEARSIARLLAPGSVAVIGASREPGGVGHTVLRNLLAADFSGPVYPVHREVRAMAGVRAYPSVGAIDDQVDLAVVAVPASGVIEVVKECAEKGVHGLVVVSSGFGETGAEGRERQDELARIARAYGLRVVGPNCLGIANTDPAVSSTPHWPRPCRAGAGSASSASRARSAPRCSSGWRSGGWASRRSSRRATGPTCRATTCSNTGGGRLDRGDPALPGVTGQSPQVHPPGQAPGAQQADRGRQEWRYARRSLRRGGARAARLGDQLAVLAGGADPGGRPHPAVRRGPAPGLPAAAAGPRVGLVTNSDALGLLAVDACVAAGLEPLPPVNLGAGAGASAFGTALAERLDSPSVDAVVVIYMPPIPGQDSAVAAELLRVSQDSAKPVLATFQGHLGMHPDLLVGSVPSRGSIPSYAAPEEAVRALEYVVRYARWRARPSLPPPELPDIDPQRARTLIHHALHQPVTATVDEASASASASHPHPLPHLLSHPLPYPRLPSPHRLLPRGASSPSPDRRSRPMRPTWPSCSPATD